MNQSIAAEVIVGINGVYVIPDSDRHAADEPIELLGIMNEMPYPIPTSAKIRIPLTISHACILCNQLLDRLASLQPPVYPVLRNRKKQG